MLYKYTVNYSQVDNKPNSFLTYTFIKYNSVETNG